MPVDSSLYESSVASSQSTSIREIIIRAPDAPQTTTIQPGVTTINTPSGDVHRYIPGTEYVYRSNLVLANTALQISSQQELIANYLTEEKLFKYLSTNNQTGAVSAVRLDDKIFNPAAGKEEEYYQALNDRRLLALSMLGEEIEAVESTDKEVKKNVDDASSNSSFSFDSIIDIIIEEGLDWLIEKANELLPPGYRDLKLTRDDEGKIKSISIGGISYNPSDNTFSYNLNRYTGYIGKVVDYINEFLPDFMDIEFRGTSIVVLGKEIEFGDLLEGEFKVLFGNISIGRLGGVLTMSIGGREMSIFNIDFEVVGEFIAKAAITGAAAYVSKVSSPGIASLNKSVKDATGIEDFVKVDFGKKGEKGLKPNVSIGPVSYDGETGSLAVSGSWVEENSTRILQKQVFNKLPGPLGTIASRIWKSLPIAEFVTDLFSIPVGDSEDDKEKPPDPLKTINVDNTGRPSNPRISSSPTNTYSLSTADTPQYDIDTNNNNLPVFATS